MRVEKCTLKNRSNKEQKGAISNNDNNQVFTIKRLQQIKKLN